MLNDPLNENPNDEADQNALATGETDVVQYHRMTEDIREPTETLRTSKWKENHGSFLVLVFFVIIAFGFATIWYQQTRFVPPRFPEAGMIQVIENLENDGQAALETEMMIAIRIAGAPNNQGTCKVAIHANVSTFNSEDQSLLSQSLPIQNGESLWLVPVDALPQEFAVAAYHDENSDQELTLNRFGIPTERYGFSREARGLTGPPRFEDAVITRPEAGGLIFVFLR